MWWGRRPKAFSIRIHFQNICKKRLFLTKVTTINLISICNKSIFFERDLKEWPLVSASHLRWSPKMPWCHISKEKSGKFSQKPKNLSADQASNVCLAQLDGFKTEDTNHSASMIRDPDHRQFVISSYWENCILAYWNHFRRHLVRAQILLFHTQGRILLVSPHTQVNSEKLRLKYGRESS